MSSADPSASVPPSSRRGSDERRGTRLLGIGLDGVEGERRLTRGEDFVLMGGSEETHEKMQDLVIRMEEKLRSKGKRMGELEDPEFEDLVRDSMD